MRKTTYPISFALGLLLLFFACNRDDTPIIETLEIIPVISSFSPTSGVPGTLVTITGDNFGDLTTTNTVRIGSTIAHVVSATATELTVILPVDAETDTFRITANKNTGTSDTEFVVEEPTLSLNVSQLELFVSESESLVVTNFVGINEDSPVFWSTSDNEVVTVDEEGTVTGVSPGMGVITAIVENLVAKVIVSVLEPEPEVGPPSISNFSPVSGGSGLHVTLTGENFGEDVETIQVRFGDTQVELFSVAPEQIVAVVPPQSEGEVPITVETDEGSDTSEELFTFIAPELNEQNLDLFNADTENLSITNLGFFGDDPTVQWASEDDAVATIDEQGEVIATGPGETILSATVNGVSVEATVSVRPSVYWATIDVFNGDGKVYKNGQLQYETPNCFITAVYVKGQDIYATGTCNGDGFVWKNGQLVNILSAPNDAAYVRVNSIHVAENEVIYAAGEADTENASFQAIRWENGAYTNLSSFPDVTAIASDVFVHDNMDYVSVQNLGVNNSDENDNKIYRNSVLQELEDGDGEEFYVLSVFVDDSGVYAAGTDFGTDVSRVWKDGTILYEFPNTSHGSTAYNSSIHVLNNDIYVGIYDLSNNQPVLFKNNMKIPLSLEEGIRGMALEDNTIYVMTYKSENQMNTFIAATLDLDGELLDTQILYDGDNDIRINPGAFFVK